MRKNILYLIFFMILFHSSILSQIINISQNTSTSLNPKIACSDENIVVFWNDNLNGKYDTYYRYNSGSSWSNIESINTSGNSNLFSMVIDTSNSIYLLWKEKTGNSNSLILGNLENFILTDTMEIIHYDSTVIESADIYNSPLNKELHISWNEVSMDSMLYLIDSTKIFYAFKDSNSVLSTAYCVYKNSGNLSNVQLGMDKFNRLFCFWANNDSMRIEYKYKIQSSNWSQVEIFPNDDMYMFLDYDAETDDSLNIHIAAHEHSLTTFISCFLYSKWNGLIWSSLDYVPFQKRSNTPYREHYHPQLDFSRDTDIIVSCDQYTFNTYLTPIGNCISSTVKVDSGWHKNRNIARDRGPQSTHISVDRNDIIHFAWIDSTDGDYDVYYMYTDLITNIFHEEKEIPKSYQLYQNYPNPFNSTTNIPIYVDTPSVIEINIYNILGQKINTLFSSFIAAGETNIFWNGKNYDGSPIPSGVYICEMKLFKKNSIVKYRKMLLIR